MKCGSFLLIAIAAVIWAVSAPALAQVNLDGRSTKAELLQIRQAVNFYVDHMTGDHYRSSDIDWDLTEVVRAHIDDKPGLDAYVQIVGEGLCGMSACDSAIVLWRNGQPKVVAIVNDSIMAVTSRMSHGMSDLDGHYSLYRWNGKEYREYCSRADVCYTVEEKRLEREYIRRH
jgi:hypothetical protein